MNGDAHLMWMAWTAMGHDIPLPVCRMLWRAGTNFADLAGDGPGRASVAIRASGFVSKLNEGDALPLIVDGNVVPLTDEALRRLRDWVGLWRRSGAVSGRYYADAMQPEVAAWMEVEA